MKYQIQNIVEEYFEKVWQQMFQGYKNTLHINIINKIIPTLMAAHATIHVIVEN